MTLINYFISEFQKFIIRFFKKKSMMSKKIGCQCGQRLSDYTYKKLWIYYRKCPERSINKNSNIKIKIIIMRSKLNECMNKF